MPPETSSTSFQLPLVYRLFFLFIEPVSALIGAYYAHVWPETYLSLTHAASAPSPVPLGTSVAMSQLGNLYLFFAINEALVLRSTSDIRVWKTVLLGLLIGDLGHLYSCRPLGLQIYYTVAEWNAIDWGSIPFVYLGASMRIAFLLGVGLGPKANTRRAVTGSPEKSKTR